MTTTAAYSSQYRVVSLNEAGPDRITVNFQQVLPETETGPIFGGPVSINLSSQDASGFFPGQIYNVSFTKAS